MTVGEKIRLARTEAGLSQRQLCGDKVTRNMLSLIENGSARPSMDTLSYFAAQLGKPVSFFLDENTVTSPNTEIMAAARAAFASEDYARALELLREYRENDAIFDNEKGLLEALCCLSLAETAISENRLPYARQLLEQINIKSPYFTPALLRQRQLLMGILPAADDRELLLRAEIALKQMDYPRAVAYLLAAEDHGSEVWNLLCGRAYFGMRDYEKAVPCLQRAEEYAPKICLTALEICFRELSDFENAYRYACKLREL